MIQFVRRCILWSCAAMTLASAATATTLTLAPNGNLSKVANVPIVLRVADTGGKAVQSFDIKVNGLDATALFLNASSVIADSPTSATLRVEYLFGPGTYDISASVQMVGEPPVRAYSRFTVPGDEQEGRKNTLLGQVQEYIHRYDSYDFSRFINMGDMGAFRTRVADPQFQVYVDPTYLSKSGAAAEYVELYRWKLVWTVYEQDILLASEPQNVDTNTLWHEMIHAIAHGATVHHRPGVLTGHYSPEQTDHIHIGYAEACALARPALANFEQIAKRYGIGNPTDAQATEGRAQWKKFVTRRNLSTYPELGTITPPQIAELQALMGFHCDVDTIMTSYIAAGYSPSYFKDVIVRIVSPATGTETADNQIPVQAEVIINEPGLSVTEAGFLVNSSFQYATLNGNTFSSTAVLKTGDNILHAGVLGSDGGTYISTPASVKSTALRNRYHVRIVWNKDDTDVDLHFSWSNGETCYYQNKTPNWGGGSTSPKLDVDDIDGFGPENITIDALPGPGTYRIWAHYYSDHGNGGTTVSASVLQDGVPIFAQSRYMTDGEDWVLLELSIP